MLQSRIVRFTRVAVQLNSWIGKAVIHSKSRFGTYDFKVFIVTRQPAFFKVLDQRPAYGSCNIHTSQKLSNTTELAEPQNRGTDNVADDAKSILRAKRKNLKGRRAVIKFMKFFRYQKHKEYNRMTAEEKILYKLRRARKKEERLVEALRKIEPPETSEPTHDPEILTPEEHFYLLKLGHKSKNYVPVGRRGIYQGVILNMHLHWKKHQTLKVIVKTFTKEEVREIAVELARLSGGIVLDIHEENTIIMYRGKNYSQPPTEIMSPKVALPRKKALDKSKYRDSLRAVRRFIPRLQQDLDDLHARMKAKGEYKHEPEPSTKEVASTQNTKYIVLNHNEPIKIDEFKEVEEEEERTIQNEDASLDESCTVSESEDLSDMFETDSDGEICEKDEKPLYLDAFDKIPSVEHKDEDDDFEHHLRGISASVRRGDNLLENDVKVEDLDEFDRIFLRANSWLNKKKR